jgi:hypothetical protein
METSNQLYVPAALPQEKQSSVPIEWEAGRVWMLWRRETLLLLPGIETRFLAHKACSLFTIPAILCYTSFSRVVVVAAVAVAAVAVAAVMARLSAHGELT